MRLWGRSKSLGMLMLNVDQVWELWNHWQLLGWVDCRCWNEAVLFSNGRGLRVRRLLNWRFFLILFGWLWLLFYLVSWSRWWILFGLLSPWASSDFISLSKELRLHFLVNFNPRVNLRPPDNRTRFQTPRLNTTIGPRWWYQYLLRLLLLPQCFQWLILLV